MLAPTELMNSTQNVLETTLNSHMDKNVLEMYEALQDSVESMDKKVEIVMKKHESEFLYAYRTHIKKIKKELEEIKKKSEEQEKMFSANDRIRYLEKQVAVFREEAIKLYDTVDKKNIQLDVLRNKMADMEASSLRNENQNKELIIKNKKLEAIQSEYQRSISSLQKKGEEQNQKIAELEKRLSGKESHRLFMNSIRSGDHTLKLKKSPIKEFKTHRNELQDWFLECIKSVKREIHQRKNSFESLDLNKIASISEFKLVDKLRLFQLLLENEKLLNWLYQKLFPDSMQKISSYLSHVTARGEPSSREQGASSMQSQRYGEQDLLLPKVDNLGKRSSSSVRNHILMKNGKMNISLV